MPLLRRPYTGPYDHERRRAWPAALGALTALLVAGLIGWAIGNAGGSGTTTRTVTHTVNTVMTPSSAYEHTPTGAVAGAEAYLANAALVMCPACKPAEWSPAGSVFQVWQLAYRIQSYSASNAVVRTWGVTIDETRPTAGALATPAVSWSFTDTAVHWTGDKWQGTGQTLDLNPGTASPPVGNAGSLTGAAFAESLSGFSRFPGAP
jgi:hypothetical protein